MKQFNCKKGCCNLYFEPFYKRRYQGTEVNYYKKRYKAGALIFDPLTFKILIIQSRGNLWGCPKGTMKESEIPLECAIREVKEETGMEILPEELSRYIRIKNRAIYFYIEIPEGKVTIQNHIPNNDASGIGWIRVDCLVDSITEGKIKINHHLRYMLENILLEKKSFQ